MKTLFTLLPAFLCALLAAFPLARVASAAGYPEREIRLIIPWNPGGNNDLMARVLQPVLERQGIKIVVENIPGGSTTIGLGQVATAKPDGYTLAFATSAILSLIAEGNVPLKVEQFTNLTCISEDIFLLLVPKNSPFAKLKDFMEHVRKNPDKVTIGVPGASTLNNLMAVATGHALGSSIRNVPYTGGSRVVAELLGSQVDAGVLKPAEALQAMQGGAIAIGSYSLERFPLFPDVPTFQELGYEIFPYGQPIQMSYAVGPAHLPAEIKDTLIKAFTEAVQSPEFKKFCEENAIIINPVSGEKLDAQVNAVTDALRAVHKALAEKK
ncbi:MAG: tripartite tricarboxylate transporter substrate binding protein [Desulfovibrio sp.]|jgi:tripartite-type tricarboxylate transporter receptor subunit TctC|nr:tripartite tricarboxylate transporter substrate binding protein [Desulfovibrio sp.]